MYASIDIYGRYVYTSNLSICVQQFNMYVLSHLINHFNNVRMFKLLLYAHLAPAPRIFLRPNDLQGIVGEMHELICVVALSSTLDTTTVQLQWDFSSNDSRITVLPATVAADDSIGSIYSTVIQFAYLVEEDEGNYTCTLTVEDPVMSNFDLEILSKHLTSNCCEW